MAGTKSLIRRLLVLALAIGLADAAQAGVSATPTATPTVTPTDDPNATPTPTATPTATLSLDHFELFGVKATSSFDKTIVSLEDQFLDENVQLTKPVLLGVPTYKNGEGITSPSAHLTCYSLQAPRFPRRTVEIVNQFGQYRLTLKKPDMLCVPSFKEVVSDD